jgi:hypothetical protein
MWKIISGREGVLGSSGPWSLGPGHPGSGGSSIVGLDGLVVMPVIPPEVMRCRRCQEGFGFDSVD